MAQCLLRERKSTYHSTKFDDEAKELEGSAVYVDPVGEQVALFLSSERLRSSVVAFVTAVHHYGRLRDSNPQGMKPFVQEWRTMLRVDEVEIIPAVRRRLQNVVLGMEFSRRLRYHGRHSFNCSQYSVLVTFLGHCTRKCSMPFSLSITRKPS
jgi:hypothetical protein